MTTERQQPDFVLYFTVVILTAVGIVTVYSASTVVALHNNLPPNYFALRQLIWAVAGISIMTALTFTSYHLLYRFTPLLMMGTVVLLVAVLIPHVGKVVNGGRRWIGASSFHIQPSEIAVITTVVYLAFFFTKKAAILHDWKRGLRPALLVIGMNAALILKEPDMGTALTLVATSLTILFASGAPLKRVLIILGGMVAVGAAVAIAAPYRLKRIMVFLDLFGKHPNLTDKGQAYQLIQGLTAITKGGWFGQGFGMSIEKTGYLPEAHTDFIFTVFVEEWGIVGGIALLVTFGVLVWRGFSIARRARDRFGALTAIGLVSMITMKSFINLGAVTAMLPVTGIPLPFISYGGTSLLVNLAAMGILLSISRQSLHEEPEYDQLADVIPVEDVLEMRRTEQPADTPVYRRPAKVQAMKPKQTRNRITSSAPITPSSGSSWRSRQESAATRENPRSSSKSAKSASENSWRARSERSNSWADASKSNGKPPRKER